jgi:glycosyltransferase involved in cell wall biosynthesis
MDILKYLHADLYLGIAGDGPERGRLERFARDIGVIDRVRFLGWRKDLPALLTTAEVFWSPGDGEDIPLALLEAMAAGLPVVASRGMATSAVLSDPTAGLLFPCGDKPALAEQTQVLLKDAMLRKSLGESARRIILEDYDLDRARSQFGAKYYSCVSR